MRRLVEAALPARLGTNFRWLVGSSWASNLGDGILVAAGPLLVDSLTDDAALVGLSWLLGRLPWMLLGLQAGVAADRLERRRLLIVSNLIRLVVVAVLGAAIATDSVGVAPVLVALFLIGLSETFVDTTATTLLPMIVPTRELTRANSRLMFGAVGLNQLIGPALGAALFTVGAGAPFLTHAAVILLATVQVSRLRITPRSAEERAATKRSVRRDIADGFRWVRGHDAVRTLVLTILAFNVSYGASASILVVIATERLGLDAVGFGLLTSVAAAGGILGTLVYGVTESRFGMANIMRIGLTVETLWHVVFAVSTTAWPAMVAMFLFGVHTSMWGTTSGSIRQASVPEHLQGRVASVYRFALQGGLIVGAAAGAVLAGIDITAPYWFGFVVSGLVLVAFWPRFSAIARTPEMTGGGPTPT
ncbi:MAG: MFS transporter [Actinomycetota bacterium]